MEKNDLNKLFTPEKGVEVEIEGLKLNIPLFKAKDLGLFADLNDKGKRDRAIYQIVFKVLKENVPDITMSDVERLKLSFVLVLLDKIVEVNDLKQ